MALLKRKSFENPLEPGGARGVFFQNTKNDEQYSYVLGCFAAPILNNPGYACILALDYHNDPKLENPGTGGRHIRLLAEVEKTDFINLVQHCLKLRDEWGGRDSILYEPWQAGTYSLDFSNTLNDINMRLAKNNQAEFHLMHRTGTKGIDDFKTFVAVLFENRRALDLSQSKIAGSAMLRFESKNVSKPQAENEQRVVAALASGVSFLVSIKPWATDWWDNRPAPPDPLDVAFHGLKVDQEEYYQWENERIDTIYEKKKDDQEF